jgi:hypothetical protein
MSGATASTYTLRSADVGSTIRVRVTAQNSYGTDNAFSSRTATIASSTSSGGSTGGSSGSTGGTTAGSVVLVDQSWSCTGAVDLDLVKVTLRNRSDNAIYLKGGCTGRIDRIEIDTWFEDGVKIWDGAHDLVIGGGYILCHQRAGDVHQDGIQAQGGARVTFTNLTVDCPESPNAALFINTVGGATPSDIVCDGCTLKPANSTVNIKNSIRSGVRNSIVCRGQHTAIYIQAGAVDPVNQGNTVLPASDSRCASTA